MSLSYAETTSHLLGEKPPLACKIMEIAWETEAYNRELISLSIDSEETGGYILIPFILCSGSIFVLLSLVSACMFHVSSHVICKEH